MNKILSYKQFEAVGISSELLQLARKVYSDLSNSEPNTKFDYNLKEHIKDAETISYLGALKMTVVYDPNASYSYCHFSYPNYISDNPSLGKHSNNYEILIKDLNLKTVMHEINHITDSQKRSASTRTAKRLHHEKGKDLGISVFNDIVYLASKSEIKSMLTEVYIDLLIKNTTRDTFYAGLILDERYNIMRYVQKVLNDKMDILLQTDDGAKYVHKWMELEKEYKLENTIVTGKGSNLDNFVGFYKFIYLKLKKYINSNLLKKEPKATPEQVKKFTKKYKLICLKNVDTFLRKCSKLYSLFEDKPIKIDGLKDSDYIPIAKSIKDILGENITEEELNRMVNYLKKGESIKMSFRLSVPKSNF